MCPTLVALGGSRWCRGPAHKTPFASKAGETTTEGDLSGQTSYLLQGGQIVGPGLRHRCAGAVGASLFGGVSRSPPSRSLRHNGMNRSCIPELSVGLKELFDAAEDTSPIFVADKSNRPFDLPIRI